MNNSFYNRLLTLAAIFGALGVIFGAFGAHFLKSRLPESDLETIKTGVLYMFIHALAIFLTSLLGLRDIQSRWLKGAGMAFTAGVLLFSGSLFLIGTSSLTAIPVSAIGFITPLGGLCFIAGWIMLILHSLKT
jgi:uncharacterized membrane protein YgdD (TMEM256/DUF423 family)